MARKRKTPDDSAKETVEEAVTTEEKASIEVSEIVEAEAAEAVEVPEPVEPEPEPQEVEAPVAPIITPRPERQGGGWFLPLLAGLAAALVGFFLAFTQLNTSWPFKNAALDAVNEQQAGQANLIDGLRTDLSSLDDRSKAMATQDTVAQQAAELEAATATIKALQDNQAKLMAEMDELRRRPPEVTGDALSQEAVAAYERELKAMREHFDAELERIRTASQSAAAAQAQAVEVGLDARITVALGGIRAALESGAGFSEHLTTLGELDPNLSVTALTPYSGGVPTLPALQTDFPAHARVALSAASRAEAADSNGSKLSSFLRSQMGVRSLSPKEGDSADAILSRAEASLHSGDLAAALQGLSGLSEPALAAMAPWIEKATTRQNSIAAFEEISTRATQG